MSEDKEIQCPVCGYYCLGKGGIGCIDKPQLCGFNNNMSEDKLREILEEWIPDIFCEVPVSYGIKAVHGTATKSSDNKKDLSPYLIKLRQERDKEIIDFLHAEITKLYESKVPSVEEIMELSREIMLENADEDSMIWFSDTSRDVAQAIHTLIKERLK